MHLFDLQKQKIDQAILNHFSTFKQASVLKDASLYALMGGGRRIRPIICMLIAESLGCLEKIALYPALAVEFFHTASLIADDLPCMDDDDLRRGQPSTHAKFGQAAAILTTYALISEGYGLISQLYPHQISPLLKEATQATGFLGASEGQLQDLKDEQKDLAMMDEMIKKKTGALFELSFTAGWIVGDGALDKLPIVRKAASHFGTAFQLFDDIQDRHEPSSNAALVYGIKKARELLNNSLQQFSNCVKELNLSTSKLLNLPEVFFGI